MLSAAAQSTPGNTTLVVAALLGIATVVVLITWWKVHPFLALILGSAVLGMIARLGAQGTIDSFTAGVGSTVGGVGLLIALGAMIGGLLTRSGGADGIIEATVNRVPPRAMPWAFAGVAALVGIPLFFEVGVVLLVPIVLLVARRSGLPLLSVGIPALAGLSVLHGFVPPHPGPLVAISALNADLGLTLLFGLLLAIPSVIIAGPLFAKVLTRYVTAPIPAALVPAPETRDETRAPVPVGAGAQRGTSLSPGAGDPLRQERGSTGTDVADRTDNSSGGSDDVAAPGQAGAVRRPSIPATVATVLLPVVLMLIRAVGELTLDEDNTTRKALDVIGAPVVALLAGTVVAMFTLGVASGMNRERVSSTIGGALGPIAGILLIVAAGGGFKQTLVDAGVGNVIADWAKSANISALVLGWLVAVGIRLATGSATVATITAAGIVAPLAADLDKPSVALLVLAVGAGSLFFSHVNDAGFWLVKEYFGLTVGQTIKSWSVMETLISVVGLGGVLLLNLVV